jgi:hypothetical protein
MHRSGIAGSYSSSVFSFWGTSLLISIMAGLVYIPTSKYIRDPFSPCILASICCCLFSWWLLFWLGWDGIPV